MARLFPKIDPSEIENPGERKVATALVSQIPSRVEVFHSFNWLGANRKGTLVEGECDFVVLDPANGILFVEVEGGQLAYDPDNHSWLRVRPDGTSRELSKDPFDQVRRSMHEILERIGHALPGFGDELSFTYGYAVAFPDGRFTGALPAALTSDPILDADKCNDMRASLEKVFDRFWRRAHPELGHRDVQAVHEALYPRYAIMPVVWRRVEDQEERLRRLTSEQQRLLEFMGQHAKAAIRGVAGSGKTILALAKAQESARQGQRTLMLCYNRPLKDWLVNAIPDVFGPNLTIDTYHGLVQEWCRLASVPFNPGSAVAGEDFWKHTAAERLMDAADRLGAEHKFDAVIVDEGQDFEDLWWTSLDAVFRTPDDKACFYVFFDPHQNLYVEAPSLPGELGTPFDLPVNCRNTKRIADHCAEIVAQPSRVRDGAPIGDEPEFVQAKNLDEAFKVAGKRVREWCMPNLGGLKPSQVAVLAPSGSDRSWPKDFGTVALTQGLEWWRQDRGVLLDSWRRFKGLEADAVIIIETPDADVKRNATARYVARSWAKHLLLVIEVGDS